jgi:hypothetical protein
VCAAEVYPQSSTISGNITDASGAVVPGVHVTVLETRQNIGRHTESNALGDFFVPLLQAGCYVFTAQKQGFDIIEIRDVVLASGDDIRVNIRINVGRQQQTVVVNAGDTGVQADTSSLGSIVVQISVQNLPLNGRNFINLVQLTAGANGGPAAGLSSGNRPDDRRQTSSVSINGQAEVLNNNIIDGMDNNERAIGTIGVRPSIDAIAEVRVLTNEYPAEVGRTAGGVINIITRSGANDTHGSLYEFFRNDKLDAKNFFAGAGSAPEYRQNQFGGSVGGPVREDKTFFFIDYEEFRMVQGISSLVTVPTEAERGGDFSALSSPIVDYPSGTQFPGNVIPPSRISPIAEKYMALYPLPNLPGLANNYASTQNKTQFSHTGDIRIDQHFNENNFLFGRYTVNDVATFTPGLFPAVDGIEPGGNYSTYPGSAKERAQNVQLNFVHIFRPNLILELRAGYTRVNIASYPSNYGKNLSEQFGLTGVNVGGVANSELSLMSPSGYASLGDANYLPLEYLDNTFQYNGSVTYTIGSHAIKAGAALIRRQLTAFQSTSPAGFFSFTANPTGDSIASFLLGIPLSTQRDTELTKLGYRTWEPSVYVQDDWRARRWLTINLGSRYDIYTPFTEAHNQISNFDLGTGKVIVAGQNGVSDTAGIATDYSNLAPRVGFAVTLGESFVLHGGYGLTFFPGNMTSAAYLNNPPFIYSYGPVSFVPLSAGLPVPVPSDPNNPSGMLNGEARDFRSGYLHQFNLNVQKAIGANVFSAAYVGELGRHLAQMLPNIALAPPSPLPYPSTPIPYLSLVPNVSAVGWLESNGTSGYHSMQLSLQRRYSKGLTFNANYTWAHGIDDVSTYSNNYASGIYLMPSAIGTYDRGNSDLDIRHRVAFSANYELPFGKELKGIARKALSNWQINGIYVWVTGLPFTITNPNYPQANLGPSITADRPDVTGSAVLSHPTIQEWFNTSVFALQPYGTLGNVGRNTLYGPPQRHLDLSLFRQIPLNERVQLQLRAESFNLTNTPSFAAPDSGLGDPGFGAISSTGNANSRQLQFALKLLF